MVWNSSNLPYIPPRFQTLGYDYECSLSTLSLPPSTVRNLKVISFLYTTGSVTITLNLRWLPPSFPNGLLAPYNVCIGAMPLEPDEAVQQQRNSLIMEPFCGTIEGNSNGTIRLFFIKEEDLEYFNVQVS